MRAGTNLEKVLDSGIFAVTAEAGPPKGTSARVIQKKGEMLRDYCDAINITDNQSAVVGLCSLGGCILLKQMGIDPIMTMACRDRNRIALQSDILGAAAFEIGNIVCLTGEHQAFGNHPGARGVFDIDSIQFVQAVRVMRDDKKFLCGDNISGEIRVFIGAVENPFADPLEFRVRRLAKKIKAGANFIQTQAVFDIPKFTRWMEMVVEKGLHKKAYILASVIPLRSPGMARFLRDYVSAIAVPDEIVTRMEKAANFREEGIRIATEIIEALKEMPVVHGVHIMASGWEESVPGIVTRAGLLPRPIL